MALFLRDYIGGLLTPTPLIEVLLVVGIFLLLRRKESAKFFLLSGALVFILFGSNPLPEFLLNHTEMMYPTFNTEKSGKDIKFVVVLAGGIAPYDGHPLTTQLTVATLTRVIEGIKIHREIPGSKIIFTGKGWASGTEAVMMKDIALRLGVDPQNIITEEESLNTHDHTQYLKTIIGSEKFVLVTSALHLPRAMRLFLANGYHPTPAPTQHILTGEYQKLNMHFPFTTGDNLAAMDVWFKEFWATRWAEVRGQI
jgi:uncharacterized SAM-binding protein YcdF (DUF218 family)